MADKLDLIGERYGRLVVIDVAPRAANGKTQWLCKCDCGNVRTVMGNNLRTKHTRSCGCYALEQKIKLNLKHGGARKNRHRPLYDTWGSMRNRSMSLDPATYRNYIGRGIKMCPEWLDDYLAFEAYALETIGLKPGPEYSIDRVDNDRGYEPGNIKWSTPMEQAANKRPPCGVPALRGPCRNPQAPDGGPCLKSHAGHR